MKSNKKTEPKDIDKKRMQKEYRKNYYSTVVKIKNDAKPIINWFKVKISTDDLFVEF